MRDCIAKEIQGTKRLMLPMSEDAALQARLEAAASACIASLNNSGKISVSGNCSSDADAPHIACECFSCFGFDRPGKPTNALTTYKSTLTSLGNYYSYVELFDCQVQANAQKGGSFVAYLTSGKSSNLIAAIEEAWKHAVFCIGVRGNRGGSINEQCEPNLNLPASDTPMIKEGHAVLSHILCSLVKRALFEAPT